MPWPYPLFASLLLARAGKQGDGFALHLAAEGRVPPTIRNYTEAVRWFAGEHLLRETCKTSWEQVCTDDVRRWMVHLVSSLFTSTAVGGSPRAR